MAYLLRSLIAAVAWISCKAAHADLLSKKAEEIGGSAGAVGDGQEASEKDL